MKTTSKVTGLSLAAFLFAGMTVWLVVQEQAINRVRQQNRLLQQQVEGLMAQADQLTKEKERLSKLIPTQDAKLGTPLAREQFSELLRLRGEAGRLRLQDRESEQSRREQMQAAQTKLASAEIDLAHLTKLHSENGVSDEELDHARFAVELLQAQAKGDTAGAARIRVQQAEADLARLTKSHSENGVSDEELDHARFAVELLQAQAEGDTAGAARIRLQQAEADLARAAELLRQSLISQTEYDEALRKVESVRGGAEP